MDVKKLVQNRKTLCQNDIDIYIPCNPPKPYVIHQFGEGVLDYEMYTPEIYNDPKYILTNTRIHDEYLYFFGTKTHLIDKYCKTRNNYSSNESNETEKAILNVCTSKVRFIWNANITHIQIIYFDNNYSIQDLMHINYDFDICKIFTTNNTFEFLDKASINNMMLNVPENNMVISLLACFKTITQRFCKYTQRGFLPITFKTRFRSGDTLDTLEKSYNIMFKHLKHYLHKKIMKLIELNYYETKSTIPIVFTFYFPKIVKQCISDIESANFFSNINKTLIDKHNTNMKDSDIQILRKRMIDFMKEIQNFSFSIINLYIGN